VSEGKGETEMAIIDTLIAIPPPIQMDNDGVLRVAGTRVTLDTVVGAFQMCRSAEEIRESYPSLSLADIHAVISYYLRHRDEVDEYLERRRRQAEEVRRENEARWPSEEFWEELQARRAQQSPA
jgi:uncharacterized protein (DUF433 family)